MDEIYVPRNIDLALTTRPLVFSTSTTELPASTVIDLSDKITPPGAYGSVPGIFAFSALIQLIDSVTVIFPSVVVLVVSGAEVLVVVDFSVSDAFVFASVFVV